MIGTWTNELYSSHGLTQSYDVIIRHSNVYYIVFKNSNDIIDTEVFYNLSIHRTEYILDNKVPLCQVTFFSFLLDMLCALREL